MKTIVPDGYKKTKFGYIPNEWKIDNFSKIIKPIVREVEKPNEPYWRLGLRSHGKGTFHEFIENPNSVSMDKLYVVEENDLIVNITFAWEHAIALATKQDENKLVSHRFPTYQFKNNHSTLFYKYYVLQPRFKYELENISPGGAGRNRVMSKKDFLKIDVLIPSSKEQTKIAEILTTWDEVIEKQEELIKEKEQLKKGLLQKLLSGEVRFDRFDDNWEELKLEDFLIDYRLGGNYENNEIINDKPLIKMGNISRGKINLEKVNYISNGQEIDFKDRIQFGDLFFNTRNTLDLVGKVAIWKNELPVAYYNSNLMWMKFDNNFFMNYLFNSYDGIKKLKRIATGTTSVAAIYTRDLVKLKFTIPSSEEQQKIAEVLSLADDEINLLKDELEELKLQKKALMQKLLTGQVRVKV
ncbi:restriction endonuclease subunit S [Aliarcobacter butzleri]|uniref:restriction endonuclease subunit S n=1 Tax=Aliarcobacter butzleri TaxID=28197 RepID=UPI0012611C89|nr:restriction endonuclease subunit S [Aliarcobacter butzleri]